MPHHLTSKANTDITKLYNSATPRPPNMVIIIPVIVITPSNVSMTGICRPWPDATNSPIHFKAVVNEANANTYNTANMTNTTIHSNCNIINTSNSPTINMAGAGAIVADDTIDMVAS